LSRFAQADTIVPSGVQGLDRYAYVNNAPLKYTDPSGHISVCQSSYCNPNWLPFAQPMPMIFSGAGIGTDGVVDISQPNTVQAQMPFYTYNLSGSPLPKSSFINYPGYLYDNQGNLLAYGKTQQAESAKGKFENISVALICYSASAESCLMYARYRVDNNQPISSITLIGPTFRGPNENNQIIDFGNNTTINRNFDDWGDYIDFLIEEKVNVFVVSDGPDSRKAINFQPTTQNATFRYWEPNWGQEPHYAPQGFPGTNTNPVIKKEIYDFIFNRR
jgi:hypothetical protein